MKTDVVVIGGGIAGLWTLSLLRRQGYSAFLVESRGIGGVQSIASQGIIHGGSKYALGGKLGDSARAIGDMPAVWKACLAGQSQPDLSEVKINAQKQLMWSTQSAVSKIAGFFAGQLMKDRMQLLDKKAFPAPFNDPAFKGVIYELNEPVLDTASLMSELYSQLKDYCLAGEVGFAGKNPLAVVCRQPGSSEEILLETRQLVLTAGAGNADILEQLGRNSPHMQKRPVHMVMVKGELPAVYAHCLGASANPRVTITSTCTDEETVWYIGGQIAESGVQLGREQQIHACQQELGELLPWMDLSKAQWATVMLDRAEVETPGGKRPDSCFVGALDGVITVWPTKLAFAPKAADQVLQQLAALRISPLGAVSENDEAMLAHWPKPALARWPWLNTNWS